MLHEKNTFACPAMLCSQTPPTLQSSPPPQQQQARRQGSFGKGQPQQRVSGSGSGKDGGPAGVSACVIKCEVQGEFREIEKVRCVMWDVGCVIKCEVVGDFWER
jgi:hypothetical protein